MSASATQVNGIPESNELDGNDSASKKAVKYDSGARDLEKVTDYAEEKEVISADQFQGVSIRNASIYWDITILFRIFHGTVF